MPSLACFASPTCLAANTCPKWVIFERSIRLEHGRDGKSEGSGEFLAPPMVKQENSIGAMLIIDSLG
jgi:hypothetical protein